MRWLLTIGMLAGLVASLAWTHAARAQTTSTCLAVADATPPLPVHKASLRLAAIERDEVQITYVGHSTFRLETADGLVIATDYAGHAGAGKVPDVVTMNHAHSTHYTDFPDPAIAHVLRGWNPEGGPAQHDLRLGEVFIRNVPTDTYWEGILRERDGNSIFIFEIAGLCIGHLGHLHHKLTPEHIAAIGRIDVLFMPVDGTYTMSQQAMIDIANQLRSSIIVPMHYFSLGTLSAFMDGMSASFTVEARQERTMKVSLRSLPDSPRVIALSGF